MKSQRLGWIQELQAIALNGLAYLKDPYSLRGFEELRELSANMLDSISSEPLSKVLDLFDQEPGAAIPKIERVMRNGSTRKPNRFGKCSFEFDLIKFNCEKIHNKL